MPPSRRFARLAPVIAAVLALTVLVPLPQAAAKRPPAPSVLTTNTIDAHLGYQAQSRCTPTAKPGSKALLKLLIKTWGGGSSGISRSCSAGGTSEHKEGRALDWRMNVKSASQRKRVDDALAWLTANNGEVAYRLGVMYIIWNQRIWSIYYPELGWRKMASRGSYTADHKNHVHISLSWDGAYQQTSWWTGVAVTQPLNSKCGENGAHACLPVVARGSSKWPVKATVVPATFLPYPWIKPGIGGSPQVGRTVTAVPGTWVPEGATLAYQWTADQKPVPGANGPTFTIPASLVDTEIRVTITASSAAGILTKTSDELAAVYPGRFASTMVQLAGTVTPGQVVTADVRAWSPAPTKLSYRWLRNGKAIKGATGAGYQIKPGDLNQKLSVQVTGSTTSYYTATATSAAVKVGSAFSTLGAPVIQGSPVTGRTVTVDPGTWAPQPSGFSYQWYADGVALSGATAATLVLDVGLAGKQLTVVVSGTRDGYAAAAVTSAGVLVSASEPDRETAEETASPSPGTPPAEVVEIPAPETPPVP